jgi:hypothetical protein
VIGNDEQRTLGRVAVFSLDAQSKKHADKPGEQKTEDGEHSALVLKDKERYK